MTCAACAVRVEKKLNAIASVSATVNLATERARVTAQASVSVQVLIEAIERAGYGADVLARGPGIESPADDAPRGGPDADRVAYLRRRLILALIFFVPLSDLSVLLSLFPSFRFPGWQWTLVALAAPVVIWAAWPFHQAALRNARHGSVSMDTLVSLGITAACGWSVYAMFVLDRDQARVSAWHLLLHASGGGIYLEVAASVTTFLLAGRLYEAKARRDAGDAMRELAAAAARDACVLSADGTERWVPAATWPPASVSWSGRRADRRRRRGGVRPVRGRSQHDDRGVDTGRGRGGRPRHRRHGGGERTAGGARGQGGQRYTAGPSRRPSGVRTVAEGGDPAARRPHLHRVRSRGAGGFGPDAGRWLLAGGTAESSFSAALAVLIIACPCSLGLATPAALMVACGRGAQLGIFIKRYEALEASRAVDTVVLDKTGTVTTGVMAVTGVLAAGVSREVLLRYVGAVEQASEHPVAAAIGQAAVKELGPLPQAAGFAALPGLGARGSVHGHEVVVGRDGLLRQQGMTVPASVADQCRRWEQAGCTTVLAGWDGQVRGAMAVADTVKQSAAAAVAELRRLGLAPYCLPGTARPPPRR